MTRGPDTTATPIRRAPGAARDGSWMRALAHHYGRMLEFHPYEKLMMGGEVQWGRRENFDDGFDVNDFRLQFSVRFNFAQVFGGE